METQINESNGSGNWIVFLFGAMLNILMSTKLSDIVDNALSIVVSGIVAVVIKKLSELVQPYLKRWWGQFVKWVKADDDDEPKFL